MGYLTSMATRRRQTMTMAEWAAKLDGFLQFNERNILTHAGKISHDLALSHAEGEFERYQEERRKLEATTPTSDFDRAVEETKRLEARNSRIRIDKGSGRGRDDR